MVKNLGGNKAKGQARKFANSNTDKKDNKKLRVSEDPLEIYAQVEKVLGNGMYNVICMDNKSRLCHSSGKFRGRNKKDNFVKLGSWLLIGLREYESGSTNNKKLQNVDEFIVLAFDESKKDDRKKWLSKYNPEDILEMIGEVTYKDFINRDLIHFSNADNLRSIPSMVDAFKPSQRKIFFAGQKRGKRAPDIKVAQFAGYIGCETEYHHGEMSLFEAIIGMAQNWTTSNNINFSSVKI
jgi:hypothetical protein